MISFTGKSVGSGKSLRKGFTLVELLVVIGIIALLIAILLPALNKARRAANVVYCSANLRTLLNAMHMYADANGGWLPGSPLTTGVGATASGTFDPTNPTNPDIMQDWDWMTPLLRVMGTPVPFSPLTGDGDRYRRFGALSSIAVLSCPENTGQFPVTPYPNQPSNPLGNVPFQMPSYMTAMNFLLGDPAFYNNPLNTVNVAILNAPNGNLPTQYAPRLSRVGDWSKKIYICDGGKYTVPGTPPDTELTYNAGSDSEGGGFSDVGSPFAQLATGSGQNSTQSQGLNRNAAQINFSIPSSPPIDARITGFRHGIRTPQPWTAGNPSGGDDMFKFNAGFFDGHVETLGDLTGSNPDYWMPKGSSVPPLALQADTRTMIKLPPFGAVKYTAPD